jgi:hypothetical protein
MLFFSFSIIVCLFGEDTLGSSLVVLGWFEFPPILIQIYFFHLQNHLSDDYFRCPQKFDFEADDRKYWAIDEQESKDELDQRSNKKRRSKINGQHRTKKQLIFEYEEENSTEKVSRFYLNVFFMVDIEQFTKNWKLKIAFCIIFFLILVLKIV